MDGKFSRLSLGKNSKKIVVINMNILSIFPHSLSLKTILAALEIGTFHSLLGAPTQHFQSWKPHTGC